MKKENKQNKQTAGKSRGKAIHKTAVKSVAIPAEFFKETVK